MMRIVRMKTHVSTTHFYDEGLAARRRKRRNQYKRPRRGSQRGRFRSFFVLRTDGPLGPPASSLHGMDKRKRQPPLVSPCGCKFLDWRPTAPRSLNTQCGTHGLRGGTTSRAFVFVTTILAPCRVRKFHKILIFQYDQFVPPRRRTSSSRHGSTSTPSRGSVPASIVY